MATYGGPNTNPRILKYFFVTIEQLFYDAGSVSHHNAGRAEKASANIKSVSNKDEQF